MASPLTVTTTSLPTGTVGTAYNTTLTATGGTPSGATGSNPGTTTYTWALGSVALPAGLTLATNGNITGTPTAAVTVTGLVFTVSDGTNTVSNTTPLTLIVNGTGLSTLDWIGIAFIVFIVIIIIIVGIWAATRPSTSPAEVIVPTSTATKT